MKEVPRYFSSIQIQNKQTDQLNISIGFEKNGAMRLCFQDTSDLGQDSPYINEKSFPNSGSMASGRYTIWRSMLSRFQNLLFDDGEFD